MYRHSDNVNSVADTTNNKYNILIIIGLTVLTTLVNLRIKSHAHRYG